MIKIRNTFLILALMAVSMLIGYRAGESGATPSGSPLNLSLMWKVRDKLNASYLEKDKIEDQKMVYGAIQGMVSSLDDPYTVFLPPKENKSANEDLAGSFGGVGISLGFKEKTLSVQTPLPKTPAERAGLLAGDLILKIIDKGKNVDRDTAGISLSEAVELIRGKIGTEVTLKIFREGRADTFDVTLKRENIVVPSMELEFVNFKGKQVAWVKMYKFSERLYTEWTEMVEKIKAEELKGNFGGIVLDLRNNPGGYLQGAVMVGSDFIDKGVIVSQQSSNGSKEEYKVDPKMRRLLNEKLVVVVNGGSASAAEILAGALKEYGRARLVGEKTFGKGTVQQPEDFPDGSGIHITVAKWLLPNGKNIHKEGVTPDVEVKYVPPVVPTGTITPTPTPIGGDKEPQKKDNQLLKALETLVP